MPITVAAIIAIPFLILGAVLGISSLLSFLRIENENNNYVRYACLGAPYIYLTVHDQIHNVIKYSRDGCLLESNVLSGGPLNIKTELRGIKIGNYMGERDSLYVADGNTDNSQILVYGTCNFAGIRPFIATLVTTYSNPGAVHAYGIGFDSLGNIYASFQHTDVVLRFYKDSFRTMPLPSAYNYKSASYYDGTFYQFGKPGEHKEELQGVRGFTNVHDDQIWIANEDVDAIIVVDYDANFITSVSIDTPVGVHYDSNHDLVFISSKSKFGAVFAINPNSYKVEKVFYLPGMEHPTGMATYGDTLFVAEQSWYKVLSFDILSERFLTTVIGRTPGKVELITLSFC